MEIEAFLADSVQAAGGKLHALGIGWRVIQASAIPVRHDRIGIGLIVRTVPDEAGQHTLTLSLLDPEGAARPFGAGGPLQATFSSPSGQGTATLALNLDGIGGGEGARIDRVRAVLYMVGVAAGSRRLDASPWIDDLLGSTPAGWIEHRDRWTERVHPDDRRRVVEGCERSIETGEPFRVG